MVNAMDYGPYDWTWIQPTHFWRDVIGLWIFVGIVSMTWLMRPVRDITWGQLVAILFLGSLIGPFVGLGIFIHSIVEANFWEKKIWP